ncbi:protein of unknown function [Hyphomicrobium sp. 1Nfss2.1]
MPSQLRTVRSEGQLVEAMVVDVMGEPSKKPHDVASNERLASTDPDLADAPINKGGAKPIEFVE